MNKISKEQRLSILLNSGKRVELNLNNTVLVLNEFQKQWTERSLYHRLIKRELKNRNVIDNTLNVVKNWHSKELPIIHAPIIQDPQNKRGFLAKVSNAGCKNCSINSSKIT